MLYSSLLAKQAIQSKYSLPVLVMYTALFYSEHEVQNITITICTTFILFYAVSYGHAIYALTCYYIHDDRHTNYMHEHVIISHAYKSTKQIYEERAKRI